MSHTITTPLSTETPVTSPSTTTTSASKAESVGLLLILVFLIGLPLLVLITFCLARGVIFFHHRRRGRALHCTDPTLPTQDIYTRRRETFYRRQRATIAGTAGTADPKRAHTNPTAHGAGAAGGFGAPDLERADGWETQLLTPPPRYEDAHGYGATVAGGQWPMQDLQPVGRMGAR